LSIFTYFHRAGERDLDWFQSSSWNKREMNPFKRQRRQCVAFDSRYYLKT
jgi:hypothetical protein